MLCDEAVINKSRRMVGILGLVTSAIRRPVIYCPNASRAFRLITEICRGQPLRSLYVAQVVQDGTMPVPGFEHHALECLECGT